ncbi:glycosyl transferase family 2, partial [Candidatus Falkowbacteria bacterium]
MTTVTVGIPAYNEADNIAYLLKDLLGQKQADFKLERIIVISDGSSDNTAEIAQKSGNKIIKVINGRIRKGVAMRLNQIISIA